MTDAATLPTPPAATELADLCREAAALERVEPSLIERDFYLTRLLWALGQKFGEGLLLKGGFCVCRYATVAVGRQPW